MKFINTELPDWIKPFAELGAGVSLDVKINDQNLIWYLQAVCCPGGFEKYLVILHPFWINYKIKKLVESGNFTEESEIKNEEFERICYTKFFEKYNEIFNLETAIEIKSKIANKNLRDEGKWIDYIWYPGEGDCELSELQIVRDSIIKLYGDVETDFYYVLLKTKIAEDEILRGKISELESLLKYEPEIRDNPSAIYPSHGTEWCIISDYDCPMTFVGGSSELINNILNEKTNDFDMYEVEPKYNVK